MHFASRVQIRFVEVQDALASDVTISEEIQRRVAMTVTSIRSAIKGLSKFALIQAHHTSCIEQNIRKYHILASRVASLEEKFWSLEHRKLTSFITRRSPSLAAPQHGSIKEEDVSGLRDSITSSGGDEKGGLFSNS